MSPLPQHSLTYVEVDVDYCGLSYGNAPCQAALGVTGDIKCFNTRKTCQDLANFNTPATEDFGTFSDSVELRGLGTNIGNMTNNGGLAAAFDDNANQSGGNSAQRSSVTNAFVGKNFSTALKRINRAIYYGSNDAGCVNNINPTVTIELRGHSSAPSAGTEGTLLGSVSFTDTADESGNPRTITSSDLTTEWAYVWAYISHNGAANNMYCAELRLYESPPEGLTSRWSADADFRIQPDAITNTTTNLRLVGINIGDMVNDNGLAAAFDSDTAEQEPSDAGVTAAKNAATDAYVGKNFGVKRRQIYHAVIYGTSDEGFGNDLTPNNITIQLRGKNGSAPSSSSDGTLLGTTTFANTDNESAGKTITSTDQVTPWQYVWCRLTTGVSVDMYVVELQLIEASGGLAGAQADKEFHIRRVSDARTLVTFDVLDDSVSDDPDQEALASVYFDQVSTGGVSAGGVAVRGAGALASETCYGAALKDTGGTPDTFRLFKYVAGTITDIDTAAFTWAAHTRYYIRLQAWGDQIKAKVWAVSDPEPDAWMVEATDTSITTGGWMGVFAFSHLASPSFDYFAASADGTSALLPSDSFGLPVTLRFAAPTNYLPREIEAIPCVQDVSLSPATISLGKDLGQRASLSVTLTDHRHSDIGDGFDKYVTERDYDPFELGTFFGKFRARQPYLRGKPIRIVRGLIPDDFSTTYRQGDALPDNILREQEIRHYVIESFDGPRPDGTYEFIAKDTLKLASGDRAQAPILSNGFLVDAISNSTSSATLTPTGIGDEEYPASGYVAIGGNEIAAFTRSGNALTLTRGQLGTTGVSHNQGDRVQIVLRYAAQDPADIIYDLLVNYAGVNADYINLESWQNETATFLNQLYTATIGEPTSVETLLSELIEQAGLVLWWSDTDQSLRLQVLRGVSASATVLDETSIIEGSMNIEEQPDTRLSQVWTFFGKINPLEGQDETQNYRSSAATIDLDAEANYGLPAVKKIYSRFIPEGGRSVALRLNDTLLSRYVDPPRKFMFEVMRYNTEDIILGGAYLLEFWPLQDATGDRATVAMQVVRLDPRPDRFVVEAEEQLYNATDEQLAGRVIIFDANTFNVNLRASHDLLYGDISEGFDSPGDSPIPEVTCLVESGVKVGSMDADDPAFVVGDWPEGVIINLIVRGRIQGCGGKGGTGANAVTCTSGGGGEDGGTALYTRFPINLTMGGGQLWAGGGGGGGGGRKCDSDDRRFGGGGGGGAGTWEGDGGSCTSHATRGKDGTSEEGGNGGSGSHSNFAGGGGGDPGDNGSSGQGAGAGSGGSDGAAIDGYSFVTILEAGDLQGDLDN